MVFSTCNIIKPLDHMGLQIILISFGRAIPDSRSAIHNAGNYAHRVCLDRKRVLVICWREFIKRYVLHMSNVNVSQYNIKLRPNGSVLLHSLPLITCKW